MAAYVIFDVDISDPKRYQEFMSGVKPALEAAGAKYLALRQSGVFASVDVHEQTKVPSTAGAGLNIPPNGARICRWLAVDLDGGDPKGPDGVIDGGRAAILELTRQFNADGSVTKRPFDHVTAAGDGAGFHHMHRLDLLMCLYKRVFEFGPDSGARRARSPC